MASTISNAIKYGTPPERLDVTVRTTPTEVEVSVRDYGRGIEREQLPRIFQRFHRDNASAGSGYGLGLYIATALARVHGGGLRVESQPGKGATFVLSLPRK